MSAYEMELFGGLQVKSQAERMRSLLEDREQCDLENPPDGTVSS